MFELFLTCSVRRETRKRKRKEYSNLSLNSYHSMKLKSHGNITAYSKFGSFILEMVLFGQSGTLCLVRVGP